MNLPIIIVLLMGLIVSAFVCISINGLVKAAIALAFSSAILSVVMFALKAPLAAVFELSVCAGLITVIFISATSMTKILSKKELEEKRIARKKRYVLLPSLLVILCAASLYILRPHISTLLSAAAAVPSTDVQAVLWNKRLVDLLGQLVVILAGVYGVIVFFKEDDTK